MKDPIERQDAIDAVDEHLSCVLQKYRERYGEHESEFVDGYKKAHEHIKEVLSIKVPSVQSEPLTDKEQRIFLAAMGREEKVCEEVDRNYVREPYEDSLMRVCKEIKRKVKGALWT